ncbi:hypothetical protein [Leptospira levettii]|uniref:hypothetical protein n=1 Tax=Leptospira levettii TaxID=2023178 RepID=UPI000C29B239|nr:hypothetical protein [Leptospira levettii]PJZ86768.1 hypothetical protein CH368_20315 [Leptospira levettii]
MNTKVNYKGHDYTLLAGMNKAVNPVNGDSYTKAMTIENNTNKDGRVIGVVLRYKGEIDDVCIEFKTSKTKNNPPISGDLALAVLGSKISPNLSTPAFQIFPFPGDGILIPKNLSIEIYLKTWAIAVPERSVMVALLMEELDDSKEVVQKK